MAKIITTPSGFSFYSGKLTKAQEAEFYAGTAGCVGYVRTGAGLGNALGCLE